MVAGVGNPVNSYFPRIKEMSLDEASHALGPCLELSAGCGQLMLQNHRDLRGEQLRFAWPYALKHMPPELVPEFFNRGAPADGKALISAMSRPGNQWPQRQAVVKLLLLANAPVNAEDFDGLTALHLAARDGDTELVRMLISFGADRHRPNRRGVTPYQLAMGQGAEEAANLLR